MHAHPERERREERGEVEKLQGKRNIKPFEIEAPCVCTTELDGCPAQFSLSLVQSSLTMSPFISSGMGMGVLCLCMLGRCNMFSDLTRYLSQVIALKIRRDAG